MSTSDYFGYIRVYCRDGQYCISLNSAIGVLLRIILNLYIALAGWLFNNVNSVQDNGIPFYYYLFFGSFNSDLQSLLYRSFTSKALNSLRS